MNRFENYKSSCKLFSASIAAIITPMLIDRAELYFGNQHVLLFWIVVALVIVFVTALNYFFDKAIEKSSYVRRLIMGSHYIEGYYYDLSIENIPSSIDCTKSTVKHGVLVKIEYYDGGFHINGVTYDAKGHRLATWKSNSCTYQDRIVYAQYESHTEYSKTGIETGLLQLQFENPPYSYSGFYFDITNNIQVIISGINVDKKQLKEYNYFNRPEMKRAFLINAIQIENENLRNGSGSFH